jgi:release factor glutamine methyltransferase
MRTLLDVLTLSTKHLQQKNIPNARREAEELLAHALDMPRISLYMQFDRPLTEIELEKCRKVLARRSNHEPVEYITGIVKFYGCQIEVDRNVLIPRPETEILIDTIAKELAEHDLTHKTLWDICCGSGCMGISLKKRFPNLNVILSDISGDALELAKKNAVRNGVEVQLMKGDLLQPFEGQKTDFVVCNPPYVTDDEYRQLDPSVKDYEPKLALVSGATGLEIYQRLAAELPRFMNTQARVWLEIGTGQGEAIKRIFSAWPQVAVKQDWAGHDRFVILSG